MLEARLGFSTADKSRREQVPLNHPIFTSWPAPYAVTGFVELPGSFA
jgi:hypothetical protein